jgi:hypothetical protein
MPGNGEGTGRETIDAMARTAVGWFARQYRLPVMRVAVTAFTGVECRFRPGEISAVTSGA